MSVDYDLACKKHKERVLLCSDGMSGPLPQGGKIMAAFSITHRHCDLFIIEEQTEGYEDYIEWMDGDWEEKLSYCLND